MNYLQTEYNIYAATTYLQTVNIQNVGCSKGSEIPAMTEVVTLEIVVHATSARKIAKCLMSYVIALRHSQQYFSHNVFVDSTCTE